MLPNQGNGTPFHWSIKHTAPKMNKANITTTTVIVQHFDTYARVSSMFGFQAGYPRI